MIRPLSVCRIEPRRVLLVALCTLLASAPGCLFGPVAWSPDGRWLAFLTESAASSPMLAPGWWAMPHSGIEHSGDDRLDAAQNLWVCLVETRRCWRLTRHRDGLSSAAWSTEGRLAYARLDRSEVGPQRIEIVVQRGFDPPVVLATSGAAAADAGGLLGEANRRSLAMRSMTPSWSPDGSYLAAPWLDPPGIAILRVSDGAVLARYPDAYAPSWSRDGKTIVLALGGQAAGYHVAGSDFGPLSLAVPTPHAVQEAIWDAAAPAFYVVAWSGQSKANPIAPYVAELVRYDLNRQKAEPIRNLIARRSPSADDSVGVYAARVPGSSALLTIALTGRRSSEMLEVGIDRLSPARRHMVLDPELFCGAVSFGAERNSLALRFGPPDTLGVPALFDLRTGQLDAIVPDHATQVVAVHTCIDHILRLIDTPNAVDPKPSAGRALRIPSPGQLAALALRDGRLADRIERLARFARRTLESEPGATPDPPLAQALAESRMFIHYVLGDYTAALRAADSLEPLLERPHDRRALGLVRAQCYIGQHKWANARDLLRLLSDKAGKPDDAAGPAEPDSLHSTIRGLLDELAEAER